MGLFGSAVVLGGGSGGGGGSFDMYGITDPALNAAVLTAIVDAYDGSIITLTSAGNNQTLQAPTITTSGKQFMVINNDTSTHPINIIANGITYVLEAGEGMNFTWDGSAWVAISGLYVDLTTNQTVAGIKTFLSSPIVPAPTTGTQATNKETSENFAIAMAAAL